MAEDIVKFKREERLQNYQKPIKHTANLNLQSNSGIVRPLKKLQKY
jgi:hypothetical protein